VRKHSYFDITKGESFLQFADRLQYWRLYRVKLILKLLDSSMALKKKSGRKVSNSKWFKLPGFT
jgi:hypothetical protein